MAPKREGANMKGGSSAAKIKDEQSGKEKKRKIRRRRRRRKSSSRRAWLVMTIFSCVCYSHRYFRALVYGWQRGWYTCNEPPAFEYPRRCRQDPIALIRSTATCLVPSAWFVAPSPPTHSHPHSLVAPHHLPIPFAFDAKLSYGRLQT